MTFGTVNLVLLSFGFVTLGIGGYAFMSSRSIDNRAEIISQARSSLGGSLEPGPVAVTGTARPAPNSDSFEAPISGSAAMATSVEVRGNLGGAAIGKETIYEEQKADRIILDDGAGEVLLDPVPEHIEFDETIINTGVGEEPPEQVRRFIETVDTDQQTRELMQDRESRQYNEGVLKPGDEIFVFGELRRADSSWHGPDFVVDSAPADTDFIVSQYPNKNHATSRSQYGTVMSIIAGVFGLIGLSLVLGGLLV